MKKIFIGLLALILVLSFAGCGSREKAAEKAVEKMLKGAGVDVDIDGDKVVIKGEDGQELTIGADEWPTSDLAKSIPEFKGGKIVSVMEADDSLFIMVEEISDKEFTSYLEEIKEDFSEETYEMKTDTGLVYMAANGEDLSVMLTYEKDSGFSITVAKAEPEED